MPDTDEQTRAWQSAFGIRPRGETGVSTPMPETTTTTKTIDAPKRPRATIEAELNAAKAKLHQLHTAVERDRDKGDMAAAYIGHCRKMWAAVFKDRPFDPTFYNPHAVPHVPDLTLCDEFHAQHYVVDRLEKELASAGRGDR